MNPHYNDLSERSDLKDFSEVGERSDRSD